MGSGKTTIGQFLAKELDLPVVDLDTYVEEKSNKEIKTIFEVDGERVFRDLETEALQTVCLLPPKIITTGGGIVLREQNRQLMRSNGFVIFLYCDIEEISTRLVNDHKRPLYKSNLDENNLLFEKRLALYEEADITVDTTNRSVANIATEIMTYLV